MAVRGTMISVDEVADILAAKTEKGFPDDWWDGCWEEGSEFLAILEDWAKAPEDDEQVGLKEGKSPKRGREEPAEENSSDSESTRLLPTLPVLHDKLRPLELQICGWG